MSIESKFSKIPNGIKFTLGLLLPSSLVTLLISLILKDWATVKNPDSGKNHYGIFCYCTVLGRERLCENYYEVSGFLRFLQILLVLGVILILCTEIIGLSFTLSGKSRYPLAITSLLSSLIIFICWVMFLVKKTEIIPRLAQTSESNYSVGSSFALAIVSFALVFLGSLITFLSRSSPAGASFNNPINQESWFPRTNGNGINCLQPNFSVPVGDIDNRLPTYEECVYPSELPPAYEEKP